jgi:hypothetical protein
MMRTMATAALVALGLVAAPASAVTINLTVSGGGLNGVDTRTCNDSLCATTLWSLASGEVYGATGTIAIDTTTNTMTISLAVATSVLDADPSKGQAAVSDGASSLVFTGGTYVTLALPVTASAGGAGTTVYQIAAGQAGAVSFSNVVATGAGPGGALSLAAVRVTGQCTVDANNAGTCGISFGQAGTTNFRLNDATKWGAYDRWVKHTFNIAVVPEPATALLLGLGVSGVAILRRRRVH